MDAAHLHVALNHFPSIGAIIGFLLLLLARAIKNDGVELSGLAVLVLAGALTIPTYFSGENAEEIVEDQAGISEEIIEEHEDAGKFGLIAGSIMGLVAAGALWMRRKNGTVPAKLSLANLVLALLVSAIMVRVGLLGGQINHPELRPGGVAAEAGHDDDDAAGKDGDEAGDVDAGGDDAKGEGDSDD